MLGKFLLWSKADQAISTALSQNEIKMNPKEHVEKFSPYPWFAETHMGDIKWSENSPGTGDNVNLPAGLLHGFGIRMTVIVLFKQTSCTFLN